MHIWILKMSMTNFAEMKNCVSFSRKVKSQDIFLGLTQNLFLYFIFLLEGSEIQTQHIYIERMCDYHHVIMSVIMFVE